MDLKVGPESLENDDDFSSPHMTQNSIMRQVYDYYYFLFAVVTPEINSFTNRRRHLITVVGVLLDSLFFFS